MGGGQIYSFQHVGEEGAKKGKGGPLRQGWEPLKGFQAADRTARSVPLERLYMACGIPCPSGPAEATRAYPDRDTSARSYIA